MPKVGNKWGGFFRRDMIGRFQELCFLIKAFYIGQPETLVCELKNIASFKQLIQ